MTVGAKKVAMSFGWIALGNYSNRVLGFITTLILAKLLAPEAFGAVAVAQMLIQVLYLFKDMGVSQALIYKKSRVEEAASTGFLLVSAVNTVLFVIALLLSPLVGKFYDNPSLTPVVACLSLNLVWIGLASVPEALVRKEIDFHKLVVPTIVPVAVASVVGIVMAYRGFDVWSLVVRSQIVHILGMVLIWRVVGFRPRLRFDPQMARELFSYGKYIVGTSIVMVAMYNIDQFYVSKLASLAALGFYTLAMRIANLPVTEMSHIVCAVMFPVLSKINQDRERLKRTFLRMMEYSGLIAIPMTLGIATYGPALVTVIYGSRWEPMAQPLRILAFYALARAVNNLISEAFKATGHPNLMQRFGVVRLVIIGSLGLPATYYLGINAMCGVVVFGHSLALVLQLVAIRRVLSIAVLDILRSFYFPLFCSILLIPGSYGVLVAAQLSDRLVFLLLGVAAVIACYSAAIILFKKGLITEMKSALMSQA